MQYLCSLHDDDNPRPALLSVMSVPTGEVLNICADCMPTWGLLIAGVDRELIDQALAQLNALTAGGAESELDEAAPAREPLPDKPRPEAPSKRPGRRRPPATADDQEARVVTELAERADSPGTSAAVVDMPLPDMPAGGDTAE